MTSIHLTLLCLGIVLCSAGCFGAPQSSPQEKIAPQKITTPAKQSSPEANHSREIDSLMQEVRESSTNSRSTNSVISTKKEDVSLEDFAKELREIEERRRQAMDQAFAELGDGPLQPAQAAAASKLSSGSLLAAQLPATISNGYATRISLNSGVSTLFESTASRAQAVYKLKGSGRVIATLFDLGKNHPKLVQRARDWQAIIAIPGSDMPRSDMKYDIAKMIQEHPAREQYDAIKNAVTIELVIGKRFYLQLQGMQVYPKYVHKILADIKTAALLDLK